MAARKAVGIPASAKTVDMFSGKSQLEEAKEVERILAQEDIKSESKERETVTLETLDRDLKQYLTANFTRLEGYRLTRRNNYHYLEHVRDNGTTYSGVYIPSTDLPLLRDMFADACKEL